MGKIDINDILYPLEDKLFYGKEDFNNISVNDQNSFAKGDRIILSLIRVKSAKLITNIEYEYCNYGKELRIVNIKDFQDRRISVANDFYRFRVKNNEKYEGVSDDFIIKVKDYKTTLIGNIIIGFIFSSIIFYGFKKFLFREFLQNLNFVDNIKGLYDEVLIANISLFLALIIQMFEPYTIKDKAIDINSDKNRYKILLNYLLPVVVCVVLFFFILKGMLPVAFSIMMIVSFIYVSMFIFVFFNRVKWKSFKKLDMFNDISNGPLNLFIILLLASFMSIYAVFNIKGNIRKLDDFDKIETYLKIGENVDWKIDNKLHLVNILDGGESFFLNYRDDKESLIFYNNKRTYSIPKKKCNQSFIEHYKSESRKQINRR